MNTNCLDGELFKQLLLAGAASLESERDVVNNLNVFPVPDGDTGTNMYMTIESVVNGEFDTETIAACSAGTARAMMRSARGNSGVILSLFFRGMAKAFDGYTEADTVLMLEAFRVGAVSAASAVDNPVEGTILTVMRECSVGISLENSNGGLITFEDFFEKICAQAEDVLKKTPDMLPALRRARVVDSGGYGFVKIIDGMKRFLNGEEVFHAGDSDASEIRTFANFDEIADEEIKFSFCTECLLDLDGEISEQRLSEIRKALSEMGDSMVLTADDEIFKLHIHTNEPLAVLGMVYQLGTVRTSKVENMRLQHNGLSTVTKNITKQIQSTVQSTVKKLTKRNENAESPKKYGIFAVSPGEGFSELFKELGADGIISGGQSMNPSADDIISAIEDHPCENAVILPNNSNIVLTAKQVADMVDGTNVIVIKTTTLPQGVSALFAFNGSRSAEENYSVMSDAAQCVKTLSFTHAVRDADIDGTSIKKDQYIGLSDGKIKVAKDSLDDAVIALAGEIEDSEFVTLYYGEDVTEDTAQAMSERLSSIIGDETEISVMAGGQPLYPYIISCE